MKEFVRTFKHYCNCGGYARLFNGRPESQPHMHWCPQFEECAEYYREKMAVLALEKKDENS